MQVVWESLSERQLLLGQLAGRLWANWTIVEEPWQAWEISMGWDKRLPLGRGL